MSARQAKLLVAELRSMIRTRDEQLTTLEHDLNNEVGTLQLVVHLMRCNAEQATRTTLLEALTETTGRLRRLIDAFRQQDEVSSCGCARDRPSEPSRRRS